jgi:hypothetical protein
MVAGRAAGVGVRRSVRLTRPRLVRVSRCVLDRAGRPRAAAVGVVRLHERGVGVLSHLRLPCAGQRPAAEKSRMSLALVR